MNIKRAGNAAGSHPEKKNEEKNDEIHLFGIHEARNI
jgi:hypothetical protein